MVKEIKIGDQIFQFKDRITGLEFVNKLSARMKEGMMTTIRMIANASTNPKLSTKDILMQDYADFLKLVSGFAQIYGVPNEFDFLEQK